MWIWTYIVHTCTYMYVCRYTSDTPSLYKLYAAYTLTTQRDQTLAALTGWTVHNRLASSTAYYILHSFLPKGIPWSLTCTYIVVCQGMRIGLAEFYVWGVLAPSYWSLPPPATHLEISSRSLSLSLSGDSITIFMRCEMHVRTIRMVPNFRGAQFSWNIILEVSWKQFSWITRI